MAITDKIYTPDDYNQHDVLKIPTYLPLILLYMLRYPVLYVLPYVPMMKDAGFLENFAKQQFDWVLLLMVIPVLLVGFALFQRTPKGTEKARKIWQHGRTLLLFALIVNVVGVFLYAALGLKKFDEFLLVFTYLDCMLLLFLWRSKHILDIFSEFPAYDPNYKES